MCLPAGKGSGSIKRQKFVHLFTCAAVAANATPHFYLKMLRGFVPFARIRRVVIRDYILLFFAAQLFRPRSQTSLLGPAEAIGVVGGEICRARQRRVRRVAVDHRVYARQIHALFIGETVELGILRFFSKVIQFVLWEIGTLIAAKRHVKLATQIIPAQTVVTMAVEIKKQQRATERILALIKLSAEDRKSVV